MSPSRPLPRRAPLCRHLSVASVKPGSHFAHCPNFWIPLCQTIHQCIRFTKTPYFIRAKVRRTLLRWEGLRIGSPRDSTAIIVNGPRFCRNEYSSTEVSTVRIGTVKDAE